MDLAIGTKVEFGRYKSGNPKTGEIIKVNKKTYLIQYQQFRGHNYPLADVKVRVSKSLVNPIQPVQEEPVNVQADPEIHFFSYDEDGVKFYKDLFELISQPMVRPEDCYVYEGYLDEDNYDDHADDYREQTAEEYMKKMGIPDLKLVKVEPVQYDGAYSRLKAENEKLKAENEKLKKERETLQTENTRFKIIMTRMKNALALEL